MPTLARLSREGGTLALGRPALPAVCAGVAGAPASTSACLQVIEAAPRDALWAFEQCLRSGACAAVLGWPRQADAQACAGCRWRRTAATAWASSCATASTRRIRRRPRCGWNTTQRWLARAQMPRRPGSHARVRAGPALSRAHVVGLHRAAAAGAGRRPPAFA
jgi:hypothetical protein